MAGLRPESYAPAPIPSCSRYPSRRTALSPWAPFASGPEQDRERCDCGARAGTACRSRHGGGNDGAATRVMRRDRARSSPAWPASSLRARFAGIVRAAVSLSRACFRRTRAAAGTAALQASVVRHGVDAGAV